MKSLLMILIVAICWTGTVSAELYKWIDENGVTHFSNIAPPMDEQVQTDNEVESATPVSTRSPGIDHVLNSYKKDALQHEINDAKRKLEHGRSHKNSGSLDLYEGWVKRDKETIRIRREELRDVQRQSYSDSQEHKIKVRYYKNRVKNAERELKKDKRKLERAKYGQ